MTARKNRFVPHVEVLERRWCPAFTVFQQGGTLILTGNSDVANGNADDTVQIDCDGNGTMIVSSAQTMINQPSGTFAHTLTKSGVNRVVVRGNLGDDFVGFRLTGALNQPLDLWIDLGHHSDSANLDFTAGIAARLTCTVLGGYGADDVVMMFGDVSDRVTCRSFLGADDDSLLTVFAGALSANTFRFDASGGYGDDILRFEGIGLNIAAGTTLDLRLYEDFGAGNISIDYEGELDGTLRLLANGGFGNDRIDGTVTTIAGSTGKLFAALHGWTGDDEMTLNVVNLSGSTAFISALLDGGSGKDGYQVTANVVKRNAEIPL
jgi:hypothetical protein